MASKGQTTEKITNYLNYTELPLKMVACWDWFPNPQKERHVILNYVYLSIVLITISKIALGLAVHLYTEWKDVMSSLDTLAESLPLLVSLAIVSYYAIYRKDLYALVKYMNENFRFRSARGLTNMTMRQSYDTAKKFARIYTACTMFSVTMYATLPVVVHLWTKAPLQSWMYMDVLQPPFVQFVFLHSLLSQWFVGLAMGQFGVFFAANSILICGQLDLLCCSLRNVRYTALLRKGVQHQALAASHSDIQLDERHSYVYGDAVMADSSFHYDTIMTNAFGNVKSQYDIYDSTYDAASLSALKDCARLCQVINTYKQRFEEFVSPLLVLRVVQVTLYLCTLLYAATLKFDMITVEYLVAVALDIFVYCHYGNQIILQMFYPEFAILLYRNLGVVSRRYTFLGYTCTADRVSTAAYQSLWHTMGVRPRRVLLNLLLANRRPVVVRAGKFLPMDLHTFVVIIKTSFSYYTLLVNVNEK